MNPSEAARWYGLAAAQGNPDGQFFSARCAMKAGEFRRTRCSPTNGSVARYAVERERTITCAYLERLDTTMTAEQTAEAQALVKEWKPK